MISRTVERRVFRRLLPLYVAAFFQGFVFFYAIEKLFMQSIGFDSASMGVMVAFYSAIMLLAETPSGILADRWSRKGVLILASISIFICTFIGGLSNSVPMYLFATAFWGIFFAMYSGTYDSVVYDTLLEETNSNELYEKYLGQIKAADSLALVVGSILGGLIASYIGTRYTYYLNLPFILISIIALLKFSEPKLHKAEVAVPILDHVKATFSSVFRQTGLRSILAVLVIQAVLLYLTLEFSQVWYIALAAAIVLYGPLNALILSTFGIAGFLAHKLKLTRRDIRAALFALLAVSSLGLVLSRNVYVTALSITLFVICLVVVNILFTKLLQDKLDAKYRAGASSAVSTLGRVILIPVSILFGYVSRETSIFTASWLQVCLTLLMLFYISVTFKNVSKFSLRRLYNRPHADDYVK